MTNIFDKLLSVLNLKRIKNNIKMSQIPENLVSFNKRNVLSLHQMYLRES